ncbi:MAG: tenA [Bacteroidetes bacterium]|nr:tenA [Bacteroidota bacterium]
MKWTESIWESSQPIINKIKDLAFIQGMVDGSLDTSIFEFYIAQDAHYLNYYGDVLACIAAKLPLSEDKITFIDFAKNTIVVERSLHEYYLEIFGNKPLPPISPTCHHYIHYLRSLAFADKMEVALASILPCFWIYKEVGDYILNIAKDNIASNPYGKWIQTYSDEAFAQSVTKAINVCDRYFELSKGIYKKEMDGAFVAASYLEYDFWDSAYRKEEWQ